MGSPITYADLRRDPLAVAARLPEWHRGDEEDAVLRTLEAAARTVHDRAYTLWVWQGVDPDGVPVWVIAVAAAAAAAFAPKGPARVVARTIAAARLAAASMTELSVGQWRGMAAISAPGLDPDLAEMALHEAHPAPARIGVAALPAPAGVAQLTLRAPGGPLPAHRTGDVTALARAAGVHPVALVAALAAHGHEVDRDDYELSLGPAVLGRPAAGAAEEPAAPGSLAIDDDPCPRRRHARKALQRLLGMKKIGPLHHTEFDHFARGAPPDARGSALEVGNALIRAGLLGTKPSVGQQHIFLPTSALADVHALVERGITRDPRLAEMWTAPAPGSAPPEP